MTDSPAVAAGQPCPLCGTPLVEGTTDLADIPDRTEGIDEPRAELNPGQMMHALACPNPECPGPVSGAEL